MEELAEEYDPLKEAEQKKLDKELRFLENYSRAQESHNQKIQESAMAHKQALERILRKKEEKENWQ